MRELKAALSAFIVAALIVSLAVGGHYMKEHSGHNEPVRDTVYDTIPYYKPVPKDSIIMKYITVKLPDLNNDEEDDFPITDGSDSSNVVIPISQKVYTDDSTYTAYVSGYMTSLDSLLFIRRTETITSAIPCPDRNVKRWSAGVHIGYGLTVSSTPQFTPYIGIGLSYKLFNF